MGGPLWHKFPQSLHISFTNKKHLRGEMTFEELNSQIVALSTIDGLDFFITGYSTLGQPIYGVHLGNYTGRQIFIEGGIHAREYPSTLVLIKMIEYLSQKDIDGGIYIVPLSNPDGARLVLDGVDFVPCENFRNYLLQINGENSDFSQWKADIMAVDLNVNFDALWGEGSQNVFCPASGNFVGFYPESEREVRNLIDFSYRIRPSLTLSFHTKGDVIYYGFDLLSPQELARDREIAEYISSINGYTPIKTENSVGGYSDWASLYLKVPAFTIEIAPSTAPTPVPIEYVDPAFEVNKDVPLRLLEYLNEREGDL